ncbi:MAG: hypothetical protein QM572_19065 [Nocardioides sp.]|uniref:hypothetical protein n=1 Tax=Nocardioides sp. TaxID=35761 RepID=UPI0039E66003
MAGLPVSPAGSRRRGRAPWGAWRFVVTFGVVSALMDVVYEGGRSVAHSLTALVLTSLALQLISGAALLYGRGTRRKWGR